jgi:phage-related protein
MVEQYLKMTLTKMTLNGFTKKTQKTPKNEIEKALQLMQKYYNTKKK